MNTATTNGRLLKLAAFLRTVKAKRFDYSTWVGMDWLGSSDLSCGTTACAMGWATQVPAFRRLGLRLNEEGVPTLIDSRSTDSNAMGFDAAMDLFGISHEDAITLFQPNDDEFEATPKYVARKIERYVKTGHV